MRRLTQLELGLCGRSGEPPLLGKEWLHSAANRSAAEPERSGDSRRQIEGHEKQTCPQIRIEEIARAEAQVAGQRNAALPCKEWLHSAANQE